MRRRAVKNIFVELFWNVIYFLPVIVALFSLAFHTSIYTGKSVQAEVQDEILMEASDDVLVDLTDTTWTFNESLGFYDWLGGMDNAVYRITFNSNGETYHQIAFFMDYNAEGGSQLLYSNDSGDLMVYCFDNIISDGWKDEAFRTIEIIDGADVKDENLLIYLPMYAELQVVIDDKTPEVNVTVYDVMYDGFTSAMKVVGYMPEDDPVYRMFEQFFITDYFKCFREGAWVLEFAGYYVYVHLLRILVDALLFIPRFCQRWLEDGMRGES